MNQPEKNELSAATTDFQKSIFKTKINMRVRNYLKKRLSPSQYSRIREMKLIMNRMSHFFPRYIRSIQDNKLINKSTNVEDFWKLAHAKSNIRWLTGSSPTNELGFLQFQIENNFGKKVLVVGVGTCVTANYLVENGLDIEVLDITNLSFSNLNSKIRNRHLTKDYSTLGENKYDFILHHLVAQHMSNDDIKNQIWKLIKSLKVGGEIRMQIASAIDSTYKNFSNSLEDQKIGKILRDPEEFIGYLQETHNVKCSIENHLKFPEWDSGWSWNLIVIRK